MLTSTSNASTPPTLAPESAPSLTGTATQAPLYPESMVAVEAGKFAVSADGNYVAVRTKEGVVFYDVDQETKLWSYLSRLDEWGGISVSPDGQLVGVTTGGSVYILSVSSGQVRQHLQQSSKLGNVAFSPDNSMVAASSVYPDKATIIWSQPDGKVIQTLEASGSLVWFPNGRSIILVGSRDFSVWDVRAGNRFASVSPEHVGASITMNEHLFAVSASNDGKLHVAETYNGAALLWDQEMTKVDQTVHFSVPISTMKWSSSVKYLALGRQNGTIVVWDTQGEAQQVLDSELNDWVTGCAWASNDSILVCMVKNQLVTWQLR